MKSSLVALPLALTYGFVTIPAHALPRFGFDLVKVSGNGIKALPSLDARELPIGSQESPGSITIAQAPPTQPEVITGSSGEPIRIISATTRTISIELEKPLPFLTDPLYVVEADGTIRQTLAPGSSALSFNADRTALSVQLDFTPTPGTTYYVLFPRGNYRLPRILTSCAFQARPEVAAAPAPAPAPSRPFPWFWIPIVAGLGVGVCAIAGCFSTNDGGGGGGGGGGGRVSR